MRMKQNEQLDQVENLILSCPNSRQRFDDISQEVIAPQCDVSCRMLVKIFQMRKQKIFY